MAVRRDNKRFILRLGGIIEGNEVAAPVAPLLNDSIRRFRDTIRGFLGKLFFFHDPLLIVVFIQNEIVTLIY